MRKTIWLLPAFMILLWSCSSSDSDSGPDTLPPNATLEEKIEAKRAADGIPSVAAAIVKGNEIVWQGYFGAADPNTGRRPDADTIYVLASISKVVTATAALQLYEQGLLDLDADINTYLPFPVRNPHYPNEPITAQILMTHRSGLAWPDGEDPFFYSNYPDDSAPDLGPWLQAYLVPGGSEYVAAMWKDVRPGELVSYSNVGAALVGYLVEAITGQDFADYCRENIFLPLGMAGTSFRNRDLDSRQMAALYASQAQTTGPYSVKFYPATTVKSSIAEFSRFAMAYINRGSLDGTRILEEETVELAWTQQVTGSTVGMFWWQTNAWWGHTGGYTGVSSSLNIHPDQDMAILVFANIGGANAVYPGGQIYELLATESLNYRD